MSGTSETKNSLWARLGAAITAYGGTIEQQRDGALLGYFDATHRQDDAERAIRAALALQTELQAVQFEKQSQGSKELPGPLSIGINTGHRDFTEQPRLPKTAIQTDESAIAVAAFLQEQAPPGAVLISHTTYRLVRGIFNLQALHYDPGNPGNHADIYLVQSAKPRAFRVTTRGVAGAETRLIGRAYEYDLLVGTLNDSIQNTHTNFVTILGDPGIGKSRLLYEFADYTDLSQDEIWLFKASAKPSMQNIPLSLLREIFTFRCDILSSDTIATAREKLLNMVQQFIPGKRGEERAHFIGQLLGLNYVYSPYLRGVADDGRQLYSRALQHIVELFTAVSRDDPLVLLLEDLQWADTASLELLEYLAQAAPNLRMTIVGAARHEFLKRFPQWGENFPRHRFMEMEPLGENHSKVLVSEILRKMDVRPPELVEFIITGMDGNPLAIEERILLLRDKEILSQIDQHWVLENLPHLKLPLTLRELIQTRLSLLTDEEHVLLQEAAIIGRNFWDTALLQLSTGSDSPLTDIDPVLLSLQQKDLIILIENSTFSATQEYTFKHHLIRDAMLDQVGEWKNFHGKAATWRVAHSGQRVGEYAGLIAYHYEQAGEYAQALEYLIRAGTRAVSIAAYQEARIFFERALAIMSTSESMSRRVAITHQLGEVYWQLKQYGAARSILSESLRLSRRIGDQQVIADSLNILGRVSLSEGMYPEATSYLEESLTIAREIGDRKGIAATLKQLGQLALQENNLDDAQNYFDQCLNIFQALSQVHEEVKMFDNFSEIAHRRGDVSKLKGFAQLSLAMAHDIGAIPTMLRAILRLAAVAQAEGQPERATNLANIVLCDPTTTNDLYRSALALLKSLGVERPAPTSAELEVLVDQILNGAL